MTPKPFKNLTIYRLVRGWIPSEDDLAGGSFHPCGPMDATSAGWAPIRDDRRALRIGDHVLLAWEIERKVIPPDTIRRAAAEMADDIERGTGKRPGPRAMAELKRQVIDTLLPVALSTRSTVGVWIDTAAGTLAIDTTSNTIADDIIDALRSTEQPFAPIALDWATAGKMHAWLTASDAPAPFAIGDGCRLVGSDGQSVGYRNRSIDGDDIRAQLDDGMTPDRIDLRFDDRVTFTLRASGQLSGIGLDEYDLDDADDPHDANLALMAGEYAPLIAHLHTALHQENS